MQESHEKGKHSADTTSSTPHTSDELQQEAQKRLSRISEEFVRGFEVIKNYPRSVTIFGSARSTTEDPYYTKAMNISKRIAKEGFAVVTGGGPGIMEAGNRGAYEHGGDSVGLNIKLPKEQSVNPYVTESTGFYYFFARKVILAFSAEAYLFFPGGYGTLDEFFEILTLIQTNKIPRVPVILVGSDYWKLMNEFIQETLAKEYQTVDSDDSEIYTITDDEDEIVDIVTSAPRRKE